MIVDKTVTPAVISNLSHIKKFDSRRMSLLSYYKNFTIMIVVLATAGVAGGGRCWGRLPGGEGGAPSGPGIGMVFMYLNLSLLLMRSRLYRPQEEAMEASQEAYLPGKPVGK